VFPNADLPLCTCGPYIDWLWSWSFLQCHDALCNIIYHALLEDNSEVQREQKISGESATKSGDVFQPDFYNG